MTIETIIMVYKPDERLFQLIERLHTQDRIPDRIRIMLTLSHKGEDKELASRLPEDIVITTVDKHEFSHGGTRALAVASSDADQIIFMTQDAVPIDGQLVSLLSAAAAREHAAVAYARQIAYPSADRIERFCRSYNYPPHSMSKSEADLKTMGIRAAFCSDTCACYNRQAYDSLGGFDRSVDFNEDLFFAFKALENGYTVEYVAEAKVCHSHDMTCSQLFKRYKDNAISQGAHPEIFKKYPGEKAGMGLARAGVRYFLKHFDIWGCICFLWSMTVRYFGLIVGKYISRRSRG